MQQVAATQTIVNDTGLLSIEQVPAFRAFLEAQGLQVRDSGAGQFFHVRWTYSGRTRWLPIERGRAGAPVSPTLLRKYVDMFLANQAHGATDPADFYPTPAGAAFDNVALAAVAPPVLAPAPLSRYLSDLRDDFALHAPLVMGAAESLASFAIRRWEYADEMIRARTTKAGD